MIFTTAVLAALVASVAAKDKRTFAVLRHYGNGPLTTCRADPIISPGTASAHVHTIMGASNFGLNVTGEHLRKSECTTALPKADMSNYWFPTLYFKDPKDGKLEQVPFYYMNVYYFFEPTNDPIKAFPLGLKMVSGDAMLRSPPPGAGYGKDTNQDPSKGPITAATITCPRPNFNPPSWPKGSDGSMAGMKTNQDGEGWGFPFEDCDAYASPMRTDVHFPSCYNPKAGVDDYKNNMAFPTAAGGDKHDCPEGWIHTPHIFFETYWNTHGLVDRYKDLVGKESPFVFANGDATGFSVHGDFVSGWDEEALQQIIDNCDAGHAGMHTCPGLIGGINDESKSCKIECPIDEKIDGKLDKLPGNNPIKGWNYGAGESSSNTGGNNLAVDIESSAPSPTNVVKQPVTSQAQTTTVIQTTTVQSTTTVYISAVNGAKPTDAATDGKAVGDFKYAGCYKDASDRVLSGVIRANLGQVNNTACVAHCSSKGFSVAGTEYGGECYCGNELSKVEKLDDSKCSMTCDGDDADKCGGDWALSVYTKSGKVSARDVHEESHRRRHVHNHYMHHRRTPAGRFRR